MGQVNPNTERLCQQMAPLRPSQVMLATNVRERILSFGGAGFGKTYDVFTIARLAAETGSDAHFYVIDTDESVGHALIDPAFKSLYTDDLTALKNITIYQVSYWDQLLEVLTEIQGDLRQGKWVTPGLMRPQDWLIIDLLSPTWQWVQEWFTERVFGKSLDEYFLEQRKTMKAGDKKGGGFEGWKDYGTGINPQYALLQNRILRSPGNVYCTSEAKALSSENVDKPTRLIFGPHGVVPVGQKRTPHLFSTVIWKVSDQPGIIKAVTTKDRGGRPYMMHQKIDDFAKEYLVGVAGWQAGNTPAEALALARAKAATGS